MLLISTDLLFDIRVPTENQDITLAEQVSELVTARNTDLANLGSGQHLNPGNLPIQLFQFRSFD
jgi:hypothetical protein